MPSNYPPGVTGREPQLAGPDDEDSTESFICEPCGQERTGWFQKWGIETITTCDVCGKDTVTWDDDYDDGPDPDEQRDLMRGF